MPWQRGRPCPACNSARCATCGRTEHDHHVNPSSPADCPTPLAPPSPDGPSGVTLAAEIVRYVQSRVATGLDEPTAGTALAAALVYFARFCGLGDVQLLQVVVSALRTTPDGQRIAPVILAPGGDA